MRLLGKKCIDGLQTHKFYIKNEMLYYSKTWKEITILNLKIGCLILLCHDKISISLGIETEPPIAI